MPRVRPTIAQRMLRVAEHALFEPPRAWPVLSRFPPEELIPRHPEPPPTRFADGFLYRALYKAHPAARGAPALLNERSPRPLARRFVERQLQLMREGGLARVEAFTRAEDEFRKELAALT